MMPERRAFLLNTVRNIGLAASGGMVWSVFVEDGKSAQFILRPPAALPEEKFIASCMKCGMCIEACPYNTLILSGHGDTRPPGTPYFIPRTNPCYMCRDIPCVPACPSGALDISLVSEKKENGGSVLNIDLARMGLAVIDRETCVAYAGIQCDACYRACPLIDKAITVEYARIERTGKHAMLAPVVHSSACTGCGLCEKVCVTEKASIFILPREIAMGKLGMSYIKGWDAQDEERLKDIPEETPPITPRSSKSPLDYLNQEGFQ